MDLASVLASRRRIAEVSAVTAEGIGIRKVNDISNPESSRQALLAFGSQPKRADCGYVGLLNQGATCYLNSLLQVLYCMADFRKALFEWHFDEDMHGEARRSLTRQLQDLFSQLQLSEKAAVSTGKLTRSFGWDGDQSFMQNDVHECMAVLMAALQTETFGSPAHDFFTAWQTGRMEHHTTCKGCGTLSVRPDEYTSLLLPVRGCKDVYGALDSFLAEEVMTGADKYACSVCGTKQEAVRAPKLRADALPPTLFLQLNRFEFDYNTQTRRKLFDRLQTCQHLDLTKYALPNESSGASQPTQYELYALLMHTGAATAGHYFAYIKTDAGWLQFNDSVVSQVPEDQLYRALGCSSEETVKPEDKPVDGSSTVRSSKPADDAGGAVSARVSPSGAELPMGGAGAIPNTPPQLATRASQQQAVTPPTQLVMDGATGAYMLVYRRADQVAALHGDCSKLVPEDLAALMAAENDKYLRARAEWEAEQRRARLRVYFDDAQLLPDYSSAATASSVSSCVLDAESLRAVDVVVADTATIAELREACVAAVQAAVGEEGAGMLSSLFASQLARLREFNALKGLALQPVEDQADKHLVKDFALVSGKSLILERRALDQVFPAWLQNGVPLKCVLLDPPNSVFFPAVPITVPREGTTVGLLRQAAKRVLASQAVKFGHIESVDMWESVKLRLIILQQDSEKAANVLNDDDKLVNFGENAVPNTLRLQLGDPIHAEFCGDGSDPYSAEGSAVVAMWDHNVNTVTISFNMLSSEEGGPASTDAAAAVASRNSVQIDQRLTLAHLKEAISGVLHIPASGFKVKRAVDAPEFKDPAATLGFFGLLGGGSVHLERGRPLGPTEYEFKIYAAAGNSSDGVDAAAGKDQASKDPVFVTLVVLDAAMMGQKAREEIARALQSVTPHPSLALQTTTWPTWQHIRLREKPISATKLGRVIVDDKPLAWNYNGKLSDGKELVMQFTEFEESVKETDILLTIVLWEPLLGTITRYPEAMYSTTMNLTEFARVGAQRLRLIGDGCDHVLLGKPWAWQLQDVMNLWQIKWLDCPLTTDTPIETTVGSSKWMLKPGDTVVFVRKHEFDNPAAVGKPKPVSSEGGGDVSTAETATRARPMETGFKIYTVAEQIAREQAKKEEEDRMKRENEERAAVVQAALEARKAAKTENTGDTPPSATPTSSSLLEAFTDAPVPAGLEKFVRLLQLGMSVDAVKARMIVDGVDPALLPL